MNRAVLMLSLGICIVLVGCNGSNSNDGIGQQNDGEVLNTNTDIPSNEVPPSTNTNNSIDGGPPDSPVLISSGNQYAINNSNFYNYFEYSGIKNERVSIKGLLTIPVSDSYIAGCSASPSRLANISVYDSNRNVIGQACGENIDYFLPADGDYIFHFDFPSNGSGYFNVATTIIDSALTSPEGTMGSPSFPREISTDSRNALAEGSFFNYFQYTADQGDKLILSVSLDIPLIPSELSACSGNPDGLVKLKGLGVAIYDRFYKDVQALCGDDFTFTFPESGTYVFNFSYAPNGSGYFDAAVIE